MNITRSKTANGLLVRTAFREEAPSHGVEIRFWEQDGTEEQKTKRAPKAPHKKSRNGCQRCRLRRVKCDEIHPICGNCQRYNVACIFTRDIRESKIDSHESCPRGGSEEKSDKACSPTPTKSESLELGESSSRRLLELRLMHSYNTRTCQTLLVDGDSTAADAWIDKAPILAFGNDALLYSLFSFTALHLADLDPQNAAETMIAHQTYLHLAIQEHNRDVAGLNVQNFDAACITSTFLRLNAFVMLRDRPLVPYTPPTEWLHITRGAMQLFVVARQWSHSDNDSITSRLSNRMPIIFDEEAKFGAGNRQGLLYLLRRTEDDVRDEKWRVEDQAAYETTISYIGGIWIAMNGCATSAEVCRRLILFPYLVHARFLELVKEEQARALTILAHYFGLLSKFSNVWWIGNTGPREVRAMAVVVPRRWQELMKWPLDILSEQAPEEPIDKCIERVPSC